MYRTSSTSHPSQSIGYTEHHQTSIIHAGSYEITIISAVIRCDQAHYPRSRRYAGYSRGNPCGYPDGADYAVRAGYPDGADYAVRAGYPDGADCPVLADHPIRAGYPIRADSPVRADYAGYADHPIRADSPVRADMPTMPGHVKRLSSVPTMPWYAVIKGIC